MAEIKILGWADYLVIAVMLCVSAGIGIYYRFSGGRQKTMDVIIHYVLLLKEKFLKTNVNFFSSTPCCTGILRCESINEHHTSCHRSGGLLHVCRYAARCVRGELHIRDTICCNKPIVSDRHSDRMLRIPPSILQAAGDKCLRGESRWNLIPPREVFSTAHLFEGTLLLFSI